MAPTQVRRLVAEALGRDRPVDGLPERMRVLVTGAAGFIGRWVVARAARAGPRRPPRRQPREPATRPTSPSSPAIRGCARSRSATSVIAAACRRWADEVDAIAHLAASISVQDSIDDPATTFDNDVVGTFNLLEAARAAGRAVPVHEHVHGLRPGATAGRHRRGPPDEAGLAVRRVEARRRGADALLLTTPTACPTTVVRPFNTYGPFQRSVGEGGVVAIFTRRSLLGEPLRIYGDGTQTRDLLYVDDCARFVVDALLSDAVDRRRSSTPGPGADVSVNELAAADRAGPRTDRPRRAHPSTERDRGPALRSAPAPASCWAGPRGRARRGPRPRAGLDGRTTVPRTPGGLTEATR